jgi:hypothetical protein
VRSRQQRSMPRCSSMRGISSFLSWLLQSRACRALPRIAASALKPTGCNRPRLSILQCLTYTVSNPAIRGTSKIKACKHCRTVSVFQCFCPPVAFFCEHLAHLLVTCSQFWQTKVQSVLPKSSLTNKVGLVWWLKCATLRLGWNVPKLVTKEKIGGGKEDTNTNTLRKRNNGIREKKSKYIFTLPLTTKHPLLLVVYLRIFTSRVEGERVGVISDCQCKTPRASLRREVTWSSRSN